MSRLKGAIEAVLVGGGAASVVRHFKGPRSLVLAYHNVLPPNEGPGGDASLHLPLDQFRSQLDSLSKTHRIVSLPSLFEGQTNPGERPLAAITFDDAYVGAVTLGVDELRTRGLPATIFVAPAFVGGGSFWWDSLGDGANGVSEEIRSFALAQLLGRDDEVRRWADARGLCSRPLPRSAVVASEEDLEAALQHHPGISLGSHTWSHPNLTGLSAEGIREELSKSLQWLRKRFDRVIPWLSYPYGLTSAIVEDVAREVGYQGAVRVDGGLIPRAGASPHAMPRINIPAGLSTHGFVLRTSGILAQ